MALVTTPGAANADSYATIAEADAYNASRPFSSAWTGTDAAKEAALKQATRLLDASFAWTGAAVDGVQALMWPRSGMYSRTGYAIAPTVIPQALKDAQSEFARQLLEADRTADDDAQKLNIAEVKAGSVAVKFKSLMGSLSDPYGALDAEVLRQGRAFDYLSRFVPDAVRLLLVPSWYTESAVTRASLIFEVDQ